MKSKRHPKDGEELTATWALPWAATLGSSVRKQGIFLEVRARLPVAARKSLKIAGRGLALQMPSGADAAFQAAFGVVSKTLQGIESLPVIPREIEDILGISTTERHRWLKDGRLPSAGTRTVKLRGRAKSITFHVFDPRLIEDALDRDLVANWREEDAETAAENRRRAAWKAKVTRSRKISMTGAAADEESTDGPTLRGWEEFAREGLLR
jgi:hypothetical protein